MEAAELFTFKKLQLKIVQDALNTYNSKVNSSLPNNEEMGFLVKNAVIS